MKKGKFFLRAGFALLVLGALAATYSQFFIEDFLGIERPFGEEPLSIRVTRYGLATALAGLALLAYGGVRKWKG